MSQGWPIAEEIVSQLEDANAHVHDRTIAAQRVAEAARDNGQPALAVLADCVASEPALALGRALAAALREGEREPPAMGDWDAEAGRALLEVFLEEAFQHLEGAEDALRLIGGESTHAQEIDRLFRHVHSLKGSAGTVGLRHISEGAHACEECLAGWRDRGVAGSPHALGRALGLLRVMVQTTSFPQAAGALLTQLRIALHPSESKVRATPAERRLVDRRDTDRTTVRVPVELLDHMMHWIDEVVALQAPGASEHLTRIAAEMKERIQTLRLLPVGLLFERVLRSIREGAVAMGKNVEIAVSGKDVQLDRTLFAPVGDVLVHLARNAIAHGIEAPELRASRGKSREGHVRLAARRDGKDLEIEVSDDGEGIDPNRIREALVRGGRMTEEEARGMSGSEILGHIFDPGFSTRQDADTLAGRGVGLDAVRVAILAVGGEVWVDSAVQRGTRFVIRLPAHRAPGKNNLS